jgi:hypothetical protein
MREWSLAVVSAKEALRSRLVVAVAGALLAVNAALAFGVSGDGSPVGRLRAFMSWSSDFDAFVLVCTAVFMSTGFAVALRQGRLDQVLSGPARRELVVLSWWLGLAAVLGGLVLYSHALLAVGAQIVIAREREEDRPQMAELLQARALIMAEVAADPDLVRAQAEVAVEKLAKAGRLPPDRDREDLIVEKQREIDELLRSAGPGGQVQWRLSGIDPVPDAEVVYLRFRYLAQGRGGVAVPAGQGPRGSFGVNPAGTNDVWPAAVGTWTPLQYHDVAVPLELLAGERSMTLVYYNEDRRGLLVTFPERNVSLMVPTGSFAPNLLRAAAVLWGRLLFLAAVVTMAASLLDAKLAALLGVFCLAVGSAHGFLVEAFGLTTGEAEGFLASYMRAWLWVVPDLHRDDLARLLSAGQEVTWRAVLASVCLDGCVRGGVVLLLGAIGFRRRELGAHRT